MAAVRETAGGDRLEVRLGPPAAGRGLHPPRPRRAARHQGGPLLGRRRSPAATDRCQRDRRGALAGRRQRPRDRLDYARDRDQLRALVRADKEGDARHLAARAGPARPRRSPRPVVRRRRPAAAARPPGPAARRRDRARCSRRTACAGWSAHSDAVRCADTLAPVCRCAGRPAAPAAGLSEEGYEAGPDAGRLRTCARLLDRARPAVLCSHGPVLPGLLDHLAALADLGRATDGRRGRPDSSREAAATSGWSRARSWSPTSPAAARTPGSSPSSATSPEPGRDGVPAGGAGVVPVADPRLTGVHLAPCRGASCAAAHSSGAVHPAFTRCGAHRVTRRSYLHRVGQRRPSVSPVLWRGSNREDSDVSAHRLALGWPWSARSPCRPAAPTTTPPAPRRLRRQRLRPRSRRLRQGHPERRGLLGPEERHRGGHHHLPGRLRGRHRQLQPDRLRRGHQAVHRRPGRLRRLRLGAEDGGEGRRRRGRLRPRRSAARRRGTCRWSPARSPSPTTSRASTSWSSPPRSSPRSSTARSPRGTTRRSPRSTRASTLPAPPIKVFFRSDESGTTENFTKYLKAAAPDAWTAEPGKKWTGKGEGKEKSAGVAERRQVHRGWHHLRRVVLRQGQQPEHRPGRQRRRRRRADRRERSARPSPPPSRTARATTCASSSTTPPRRPAPTRSSSSPTRSSAPRARTRPRSR